MVIKCPCNGRHPSDGLSFIGVTAMANEYGTETKFAWFSDGCGHYVYLVVRAPFTTHGHGGEYEVTHTVTSSVVDKG